MSLGDAIWAARLNPDIWIFLGRNLLDYRFPGTPEAALALWRGYPKLAARLERWLDRIGERVEDTMSEEQLRAMWHETREAT